MEQLTAKQIKVLEHIEARLEDNNPASQREVADHFGLAQNAVFQLTGYLRKKGYLVSTGSHRGLRLSDEYLRKKNAENGYPVIGRVAAGEPMLAEENIEDHLQLKQLLGLDDDVFFLRVAGDSMIDEGIMDGDLVAVKPGADVPHGKIAVVLLDDEATIKRVFFEKNRIALKPANKQAGYKIRYIQAKDKEIRIVGTVISCVRSYRR